MILTGNGCHSLTVAGVFVKYEHARPTFPQIFKHYLFLVTKQTNPHTNKYFR